VLTVLGFLILMTVPSFTTRDTIGTHTHVETPAAAHAPAH
jgi:hypothetical protein